MDTYVRTSMQTCIHIYVQTLPLQHRHEKLPLPASQYMSATERHKQQYTGTPTRSGRRLAVRMHAVMQNIQSCKEAFILFHSSNAHVQYKPHAHTTWNEIKNLYQHTSKDIQACMHACMPTCIRMHAHTNHVVHLNRREINCSHTYIRGASKHMHAHILIDTHLCQDDILHQHTHVCVHVNTMRTSVLTCTRDACMYA